MRRLEPFERLILQKLGGLEALRLMKKRVVIDEDTSVYAYVEVDHVHSQMTDTCPLNLLQA